MATKKAVVDGTRELLVRGVDGEFKINIPADAKVTFGPAIPQSRKDGGFTSEREYALRIYKGTKDNLIAVFTGVREFREAEMPVFKLVVKEAGKKLWKSDEEGYSVEESVKRKGGFVDLKKLNAGEEF